MRFNLLILVFFVSGLSSSAVSSNYYVDKNASGNNSGTSWVDAWETFSAISWENIKPGDVIYISGDNDSLVYNEKLDILVSGTSGNPITITSGIDNGHSGKVIIDVNKNFANALEITGEEYIIVSNLHLRNANDSVIKIKNSLDILIENCSIHTTVRSGINISENENITISGCNITTDQLINHQTDGIYSQNNINNIYEYNHIIISNRDTGGHDDCIQSYRDASLIIKNNYTEQNNSKTSNAQGIYVTTPVGSDTTRIYNNIFNATLSSSNGIVFDRVTGSTSARVQIIGNTVYGENLSAQYRVKATIDPVVKNNIGYSVNGNWIVNLADVSFSNPSNIDNNIWKCGGNEPIIIDGSLKSWTSWQNSGFDLHSHRTDPKFNDISNNNFTLKATSDGIDNGQALYPPYNLDINDTPRPQGGSWDIGAYEHPSVSSTNDNKGMSQLKKEIFLSQNYPNPFNPSTTISFTLPKYSKVRLVVLNVLGEELREIVNSEYSAGTYKIVFNKGDISSGIYFYRIEVNDYSETRKMIIIQ